MQKPEGWEDDEEAAGQYEDANEEKDAAAAAAARLGQLSLAEGPTTERNGA